MIFKNSFICTIFLCTFFYNGEAVKTVKLNGKAITPVLTAFKTDGSLDLSVIPAYAAYLKRIGTTTIWLLGGPSGQAATVNLDESIKLLNAWLPYKKYFTIIVEVGYLTVTDSCKFAQYCEKVRIPALTYKIPTLGGARTPQQAADDFKNVADCACNTPIFFYYDSSAVLCDRNPPVGVVVSIIIKTVPNFAGVFAPIEIILQVRAINPKCQVQLIVYFYYSVSAAYLNEFDGFATPLINIYPAAVRKIMVARTTAASLSAQDYFSTLAFKLCSLDIDECRTYCPINIVDVALQIVSRSEIKIQDTRRPYCTITSKDRSKVYALLKSQGQI